ncbi:hypothetical protein HS088_TW22G00570 [Tripterygium wilfordii]|uniref:Kinesin-like protein n=1 Tax=Tripterygium wilfordii TaxID=458696 RepID=A0A7J7BYX0_TRIWF|nr:hypothetical protein HS088_TW22G00570 [Tripterygium wilfordii]
MGRQGQRSGAAAAHHQRQHSDNFLESSSNGRWLQTAGLQQLHSSNATIPPLQQDYNFYGGDVGGQGSRLFRNAQRGFNGVNEFYTEPASPPVNSRSLNQRKNGEDSPNEFSPGLLDLHSFDTELLPEMQLPGLHDGSSIFHHLRGRSFDDSETYIASKQQTGRSCALPENNLLKSLVADKEKANTVAKIKVVVRKRPLNKKELAKNEEDIIDTHSNSLTVHETKLKTAASKVTRVKRVKGSGKTYTMKPLPLKASRDILRLMLHTYRNQGYQLFFSFFEIYGGKLFDLLNERKKLFMREDGKQQVCIVGLQEYRVSDVETIKELIEKGNSSRSTGTTGANEESSRSHAILQLAIKKSVDAKESKPPRLVGKLSFIDLAGSERGADTTDNDKQTRVKSLSKGNNPRKDVLSSTMNLKESTTVPLSSALPSVSNFENDMTDAWPQQNEGDNYDVSEDSYEHERPMWKKSCKLEQYSISISEDKTRKPNHQTKWNELLKADLKSSSSDDELNALLQEEEDLVNAHRKQVEETMNIVREATDVMRRLRQEEISLAEVLDGGLYHVKCKPL